MNCGPNCRCNPKGKLPADIGDDDQPQYFLPDEDSRAQLRDTSGERWADAISEAETETLEVKRDLPFQPTTAKGDEASIGMVKGIYDPTSAATYQAMKATRREAEREEQAEMSQTAWAKLHEEMMASPKAKAAYERVKRELAEEQEQDGEGM